MEQFNSAPGSQLTPKVPPLPWDAQCPRSFSLPIFLLPARCCTVTVVTGVGHSPTSNLFPKNHRGRLGRGGLAFSLVLTHGGARHREGTYTGHSSDSGQSYLFPHQLSWHWFVGPLNLQTLGREPQAPTSRLRCGEELQKQVRVGRQSVLGTTPSQQGAREEVARVSWHRRGQLGGVS